MGDYTFLQHGDAGIGAMMTNPRWRPAGMGFLFPACPTSNLRKPKSPSEGAVLTHGPMEVPGGEMVLNA
jgi:hypothetical protein